MFRNYLLCIMIGFAILLFFDNSWSKDPMSPQSFNHKIRKNSSQNSLYPAIKIKVALSRVHDNIKLDTPYGYVKTSPRLIKDNDTLTIEQKNMNIYDTSGDHYGYSKRTREIISYQMSKLSYIELINRENINSIVREWDFSDSDYVKKVKTPEIKLPDIIAKGYMTANSEGCYQEESIPWDSNTENKENKKNPIKMLIKFYNVQTSKTEYIACGTGKNVEKSIKNAVQDLKKHIDQLLPDIKVVRLQKDIVYLDGGTKDGLEPGVYFYLVRAPGGKKSIDYTNISYLTKCKVKDADKKTSKAVVVEKLSNTKPNKGDFVFYHRSEPEW